MLKTNGRGIATIEATKAAASVKLMRSPASLRFGTLAAQCYWAGITLASNLHNSTGTLRYSNKAVSYSNRTATAPIKQLLGENVVNYRSQSYSMQFAVYNYYVGNLDT